MHQLRLGRDRDGLLVVPPAVEAGRELPLVVGLHGAGGAGRGRARWIGPLAEAHGFLLLAPDSRGRTWDAIRGEYGEDVEFIERAVQWVFERCPVDRARMFLEGFSDGASYALGLGLANGDLFPKIAAFSPGFIPDPGIGNGTPGIFISHGTSDRILPIDRTSRRIVPRLRAAGLAVSYHEFTGDHEIPQDVARRGMRWLLEA